MSDKEMFLLKLHNAVNEEAFIQFILQVYTFYLKMYQL